MIASTHTHILIISGKAIVERLEKRFLNDLAKYNRRLELLKSPVVICDRHMSNGKEYRGRYFKERYYDEDADVIKWRYIGTTVPEDFVPRGGFPPCPDNPLEGWDGQVIGDSVIMRPEIYERLIDHFTGLVVVPVNWSDDEHDGVERRRSCITGQPYCLNE